MRNNIELIKMRSNAKQILTFRGNRGRRRWPLAPEIYSSESRLHKRNL